MLSVSIVNFQQANAGWVGVITDELSIHCYKLINTLSLHTKMKIWLWISTVNVTKSITDEILRGKLHFLCNVYSDQGLNCWITLSVINTSNFLKKSFNIFQNSVLRWYPTKCKRMYFPISTFCSFRELSIPTIIIRFYTN